ncbi:MAG: hypothetical protein J6V90_08020 [Treponema sp.]|nr:hypothetical protein [Treponema sp.]
MELEGKMKRKSEREKERIEALYELVEKKPDAFFFLFLLHCLLLPQDKFEQLIKSMESDLKVGENI